MSYANLGQRGTWSLRLLGLAAIGVFLVVFWQVVVRPYYLLVTDQAGPFYLTFSLADLDLDGDQDALVHNMRKPQEFEAWTGGGLWINQGGLQGGRVGQLVYRPSDIEGGAVSTTADLDADGDPDLLVYEHATLIVGVNQNGEQAGVFRRATSISPPAEYRRIEQYGSLATGDLNGDAKSDVLLLGCCSRAHPAGQQDSPNVSFAWLNETNAGGQIHGKVAAVKALEGLPIAEAALGDLDGDKDLDVFATVLKTRSGSGPGPTSIVLLNDSSGRFSDSGQRLGAEEGTSMSLGDVDSDGDVDALVGHGQGATIWINQGGAQRGQAGAFAVGQRGISGNKTRSVILMDLDRDIDLDAVVVGKSDAVLWWNDGQGAFAQAGQHIPCSDRQDLTVGDFDGDANPDMLIAEYDHSSKVWYGDGKGGFQPRDQRD